MARRLNKYIDETEPWTLAKDESKTDSSERSFSYNLLEGIKVYRRAF
ncbi:MAG: hypothetical protein L6V93_07005 [Clostridiales bacterium]|nr:MAG: hypothetical protein L6V93_07005 [Clostridiales bacterium]